MSNAAVAQANPTAQWLFCQIVERRVEVVVDKVVEKIVQVPRDVIVERVVEVEVDEQVVVVPVNEHNVINDMPQRITLEAQVTACLCVHPHMCNLLCMCTHLGLLACLMCECECECV